MGLVLIFTAGVGLSYKRDPGGSRATKSHAWGSEGAPQPSPEAQNGGSHALPQSDEEKSGLKSLLQLMNLEVMHIMPLLGSKLSFPGYCR